MPYHVPFDSSLAAATQTNDVVILTYGGRGTACSTAYWDELLRSSTALWSDSKHLVSVSSVEHCSSGMPPLAAWLEVLSREYGGDTVPSWNW